MGALCKLIQLVFIEFILSSCESSLSLEADLDLSPSPLTWVRVG